MQIDALARLVDRGVAIAAASRYARGGRYIGGPLVKSTLSRIAGLSLHFLARVGTRDATNSFKAYSTEFVRSVGIDSDEGFEVGLELVAKARRLRLPVAEIPTIWLERTSGQSNFKLQKWLPHYLRWYLYAFGPKLVCRGDPQRSRPVPVRFLSLSSRLTQIVFKIFNRHKECVIDGKCSGQRLGWLHRGYVVEELLRRGHQVVGIDNLSKYGRVTKSYDDDPGYTFVEGDAQDVDLLTKLLSDCDHFIAGAAMIGGISYFHTYAYDLLATNERIIAASCDAAIEAHREGRLQKVTYLSSSMVFESATRWPSEEGQEHSDTTTVLLVRIPEAGGGVLRSRRSLPVRPALHYPAPFNCVGIGERRALGDIEILSGNVSLVMSHVVPDLVQKALKGQDPLHILGDGSHVRHHPTVATASSIVSAMEHHAANATLQPLNVTSTTTLQWAETIWK